MKRGESQRMTDETTQAVVYARVSSKEQERDGYAIPAQLKLLRDYALHQDLDVARSSSMSRRQAGRLAVQLQAPLDLILVETGKTREADAADAATGVVEADFANWRGVVDTFRTLVPVVEGITQGQST